MSPDDRISLTFTAQQLDYIVRVIRRCPWEEAQPLLEEMTKQVAAHNQERAQPMTGNGAEAPVMQQ